MRKILLGVLLSLLISFGYAENTIAPLPAEKAFSFSIYLTHENQLVFEWNIAPGYYIYRDELNFTLAPTSKVAINKINLPLGKYKNDIIRGKTQIYSGKLRIPVNLINSLKRNLNMSIIFQGCSAEGFCYSPIKKNLNVDLSTLHAPVNLTQKIMGDAKFYENISNQNYAATLFVGHGFLVSILIFLGLGLLLAFTPCILPMIPILSGIIVGQKKLNTYQAFLLSLTYVIGMAITYAFAGVFIAMIGSNLQATLQKPWIIILFSGLFALLALSLFGFYDLKMPVRLQQYITQISSKQKSGTFIGVLLMGCLSSLIVSPCVSAPLVGVLAYIAHTGNILFGGIALFMMGLGMGFPLLLIGTSAGRLLPKTGPWMESIKKIFGILMLGLTIWMLSRIIYGPAALFLWSVLFIACALFINSFIPFKKNGGAQLKIAVSVVSFIYGTILMIGAVLGNEDPLHPWGSLQFSTSVSSFRVVKNWAQFDEALRAAKQAKTPVLFDFYADWCASCVAMDKNVFSRKDVKQALKSFLLLRADVTAYNDFDRAIMKRFHVIAPPTIVFFDAKGNELSNEQSVGEKNTKELLAQLNKINPQ